MMKIPETVRIQGIDYRVSHEDVVTDGIHVLMGEIRYPEAEIALSDTACPDHQVQCLTLWHEILHGIRCASGMEIGCLFQSFQNHRRRIQNYIEKPMQFGWKR